MEVADMQATAKDLRFYSKELIENVLKGEEIVITYHGKPIAKLVPIEENGSSDRNKNELFGIWKDNDRVNEVGEYISSVRKGRFE